MPMTPYQHPCTYYTALAGRTQRINERGGFFAEEIIFCGFINKCFRIQPKSPYLPSLRMLVTCPVVMGVYDYISVVYLLLQLLLTILPQSVYNFWYLHFFPLTFPLSRIFWFFF